MKWYKFWYKKITPTSNYNFMATLPKEFLGRRWINVFRPYKEIRRFLTELAYAEWESHRYYERTNELSAEIRKVKRDLDIIKRELERVTDKKYEVPSEMALEAEKLAMQCDLECVLEQLPPEACATCNEPIEFIRNEFGTLVKKCGHKKDWA